MSMVSAKTLEITGVRSPDLSRCREIFGKYSKFYKEDDALEILEANADKTDVIKLFLESVDCPLNGQKLSGIIGKIFCFRAVPSYGIQQKLVSVYDLMLSHLSDGKDDLVRECIKAAIENGLIALIIRVLEDTKADGDLLIHVEKYEGSHSKEVPESEAVRDKVYRRQVLETDGAIRDVVENAIGSKPLPDPKDFFKDQSGSYEPRLRKSVIREAELSEYIYDEREMDIVDGLVCENPDWDHFYEKDLSAEALSKMAMGEYNWGDGPVIPYVIIKQKNCDKDTAKKIFEFADGDSYLANTDPKPWELEWIAFFRALRYQIDN